MRNEEGEAIERTLTVEVKNEVVRVTPSTRVDVAGMKCEATGKVGDGIRKLLITTQCTQQKRFA